MSRTTLEGATPQSSTIQHERVATGLSYDQLVGAFERELGHLDPLVPKHLIEWKAEWSEVEREIGKAAGPHGLMIIARADQGSLISLAGSEKRCSLYLVGNPVIAFDRPSSFLATLGQPEIEEIGRSLDRKIDAVIAAIRTR
jgi:hypothetical protein